MVTKWDVLVEKRLRDELAQFDSGIDFSGEETGVHEGQKIFWLVDPIDGTEAFIRGLPFCTNMLALIDNNQVVMSVIYNFTLDEFYVAIKGHGATCNGHAIRVSNRPLSHAYVTLYGNVGMHNKGFADALRAQVHGMPKSHASGCDYAWMARLCGALEGRLICGIMRLDPYSSPKPAAGWRTLAQTRTISAILILSRPTRLFSTS